METFMLVMQAAGMLYTGISKAIEAARAGNDEEALTILEQTVANTGVHIGEMRAQAEKRKQEHAEAIDKKFPVTNEDTKQP